MHTCYRSEPESVSDQLRKEFEPPGFDAWLDRLAGQGMCQILVALSLKLGRLDVAPLDGQRRLEAMQRLVPLVRDVADELPRVLHSGRPPRWAASRPLSLEQRLVCLTFRNLKRTLECLVRSGGGRMSQGDEARRWVLRELFVWLGRQIELGALWGRPWPAHTWHQLHDLYDYCRRRGVDQRDERSDLAGALDRETTYKRLLLMGLIADRQATALLAAERTGSFAAWVDETELKDPGSYFGVLGVYLVECSSDEPPRQVQGALGPVNRGWVLSLPTEFTEELAASKGARDLQTFGIDDGQG